MKVVVCLSGGQDSTVALAIASNLRSPNTPYDEIHTFSMWYGQRHDRELECAGFQSRAFGAIHHEVLLCGGYNEEEQNFIKTDIFQSALTSKGEIPEDWDVEAQGPPPTIVLGRNQLLISLAACLAGSIGAEDIWIGCSEIDYSGYPDCREGFLKALTSATALGQERTITIRTPILHKTKKQMIQRGLELGVDFSQTWTCYRGEVEACGKCPACGLRLKAFAEVGHLDPIPYSLSLAERPDGLMPRLERHI